ncbi:MAG: MobA/MobL family protein, partial [Hyphomicrobium sp.]
MTTPPAAEGHYHLHVHAISKLKGHSIQAAAAYRRAELFRAEPNSITHAAAYQRAQQLGNDGKVFDYRRKIGVAWTCIIAPDCTPEELLDAQTLWNTVERIECRKNARLAREMIIALPHQVDLDVHIIMLRSFITRHLTARGMIADVAIHRPPVEHGGDPRNWHAHVLLTDRPITATGFSATKNRMW